MQRHEQIKTIKTAATVPQLFSIHLEANDDLQLFINWLLNLGSDRGMLGTTDCKLGSLAKKGGYWLFNFFHLNTHSIEV